MGLEFQSRGFVYLNDGDVIESDLDTYHFNWWQTGTQQQFLHFCADAKGHSYAATRQVAEQVHLVPNSIGFFSLSADYCDAGPGYDRAYLLMDNFREINTRSVDQPNVTPTALFNHFALCQHLQYDTEDTNRFLDAHNPTAFEVSGETQLPIAAWFYSRRPHPELEAATDLFSNADSVTVCSSGGWDDQYLFFGDYADVSSTVTSMLSLSARFPSIAGLVFLVRSSSLEQMLVFGGHAYSLGSICPNELDFHSDIQFNTDRSGYVQR